MINVRNLSFGFPQKELFHKISFILEEGQHAALIGSSGAGKSTLAELLMGLDRYTFEGVIETEPSARISYISQFSQSNPSAGDTVFTFVASEFIAMRQKMDLLCDQMSSASQEDTEGLLEAYQSILDAYLALDGDNVETQIQKQLNLASLNGKSESLLSTLSGGEFKLAQVIKAMLNHPQLLIMDEPDAFLDFENLNALVLLIENYSGTLLVLTHSRFLLNHCFNKIIHLENKEIQEFEGTYIEYNLSLLLAKIDLQEQSFKHSEAITKNEALIEQLRFIATYNTDASRGKALKARVKHHERLEAQAIKEPFVEIQEPPIRFTTTIPLSGVQKGDIGAIEVETGDEAVFAIRLKDYSVAFDEVLLDHVSFEIGPNDKVALLGPNGSGKTTLLREIAKGIHSAIEFHPDLKIGYLSQLQGECLNLQQSLIDALYDTGMNSTRKIITHLGYFGFSDEACHQKIAQLSGGEKNLLQLAILSVQDANLLLLDEPTSHLDTYGQRALEKAIANYEGAVFMVSHDFYTIANCMDYVLMIEGSKIKKLNLKKFKRMVFANHFDKDYLTFDAKRKSLELEVSEALSQYNFERAKGISQRLEAHIASR